MGIRKKSIGGCAFQTPSRHLLYVLSKCTIFFEADELSSEIQRVRRNDRSKGRSSELKIHDQKMTVLYSKWESQCSVIVCDEVVPGIQLLLSSRDRGVFGRMQDALQNRVVQWEWLTRLFNGESLLIENDYTFSWTALTRSVVGIVEFKLEITGG